MRSELMRRETISTHTLRKEGDDKCFRFTNGSTIISTHTLRKEGDY